MYPPPPKVRDEAEMPLKLTVALSKSLGPVQFNTVSAREPVAFISRTTHATIPKHANLRKYIEKLPASCRWRSRFVACVLSTKCTPAVHVKVKPRTPRSLENSGNLFECKSQSAHFSL